MSGNVDLAVLDDAGCAANWFLLYSNFADDDLKSCRAVVGLEPGCQVWQAVHPKKGGDSGLLSSVGQVGGIFDDQKEGTIQRPAKRRDADFDGAAVRDLLAVCSS